MAPGGRPSNDDSSSSAPDTGFRGQVPLVAASILVAALAVGALFVFGMPGMNMSGGSGSMPRMEMRGEARRLAPATFQRRLRDDRAFVVNVHTPYFGEIRGTDAFIPFTSILEDARLPRDRDTAVLLYCRSGRMSTIAARTLTRAGYTRVAQLDGGMNAWVGSRRPLTHNRSE